MMHPDWERYYGDSFIVNFGSEEKAKVYQSGKRYERRDRSNWHTDDDWYRMFLDSAGNALTIIHCFTDIPENGGGTFICEDGITGGRLDWTKLTLGILEKQYAHPEGLDPPIGAPLAKHCRDCKKFDQVVAEAGDIILLHGDLPHCAGPNYLHYARIISNPHAALKDAHNLNRPDGNYVGSSLTQLMADSHRASHPQCARSRVDTRVPAHARTALLLSPQLWLQASVRGAGARTDERGGEGQESARDVSG